MRQPNFNVASCDSSQTTESLKTSEAVPLALKTNDWSFEEEIFGSSELDHGCK